MSHRSSSSLMKSCADHQILGLFFHTHFFFLHEFRCGASIVCVCVCVRVCVCVCVFAKFALSINMTCLLISAIIVCVVFVQEFANKQADAIKHTHTHTHTNTHIHMPAFRSSMRRQSQDWWRNPARTNVRREKSRPPEG